MTGADPGLDEATRPTAGPYPVDDLLPEQQAVGQHLVQVHDHFRAELSQVRDVLGQVRGGVGQVGAARDAVQSMSLRANAWVLGGLCQRHCLVLTQHHELESGTVFPHLGRALPDLVPVLDRLHEEHLVVHAALEAVDRALVELARDPAELAPVTAAVDELSRVLLSHFAYEERELVGPLSRVGFFPGQA